MFEPLLPIICVKCGYGCIAPVFKDGKAHHKSCLPPAGKVKVTGTS